MKRFGRSLTEPPAAGAVGDRPELSHQKLINERVGMKPKRVSLVKIAKEAGVSAQTVSRVVHGHSNVALETREKIQAIIDRRGYHPSRFARGLLRGRSYTIGVVSYELGLYGPSQTLAGIVREANKQGYSVLPNMWHDAEKKDANEVIGELLEYHVDGIIWAVPQIGDNRDWVQKVIKRQDIPIVFTTMENQPNLTIVTVNNRAGGRLATQHLIDRGCRTIGMIKGHPDWWEARERLQGWREAMRQNGLTINESLIVPGDWSAEIGEKQMAALLQRHPEIDGVFVANDSMAVGGLKAARQLGRKVPDDLAVIGFDDVPEAAYFYPALTTIRQNLDCLGSRAVTELNKLIDSNKSERSLPTEPILIEPELIVRESS